MATFWPYFVVAFLSLPNAYVDALRR